MVYDNKEFIKHFIEIVKANSPSSVLFVCSSEYDRYGYRKALDKENVNIISFTEFEPCPERSSVFKGVECFKQNSCDFIIVVGGGSAIDVAKAIKLFAEVNVKILAVPTTSGTGAEVTRFSVLYENGDKNSVRSWDIIPDYQVFDYTTLKSLPYVQRVVTGLDAFVHALEAYWSLDATDESRNYSIEALNFFNENFKDYLSDDKETYYNMMKCSELAGRAINIAQTTAAHAFSYKLHKIKGFYHGQAVAVSLVYIWKYMLSHADKSMKALLNEVERVSGFTPESLEKLLKKLNLLNDLTMNEIEFEETVNGVDASRLSNHPMKLTNDDIRKIYASFIEIE